jgi:hypothetical protein
MIRSKENRDTSEPAMQQMGLGLKQKTQTENVIGVGD